MSIVDSLPDVTREKITEAAREIARKAVAGPLDVRALEAVMADLFLDGEYYASCYSTGRGWDGFR